MQNHNKNLIQIILVLIVALKRYYESQCRAAKRTSSAEAKKKRMVSRRAKVCILMYKNHCAQSANNTCISMS